MDKTTNNNPFISYGTLDDTVSLDATVAPTDHVDLAQPTNEEPQITPPVEVEPVAPTQGVVEAEAPKDLKEEVSTDNSGDGVTDGVDTPEDVKVNAYYAAQRHLLEEGLIEEDSLNPDATWEDISTILEKRVEQRVQTQISQELEAKGHTEQTLMYAQMIAQGKDPREILPVNQMYQIASLKGQEDVTDEIKTAVVQNMYQLRNLDPTEGEKLISLAKAEEDGAAFKALYEKALDYHAEQYTTIQAQHQEKQKAFDLKVRQEQQARQENIKSILTTRKVGDLTFSKAQAAQLQSDIYNKDQVFVYNDVEQRGSKMDKFMADFLSNDEMKIKAYLLLTDPEGVKSVAKDKAKIDIEKEILRASQTKTVKKSKEKQEVEELTFTPKKVY